MTDYRTSKLFDDESDQMMTPSSVQTLIINPKVDETILDLCCPECNAVIQGTSPPDGHKVEYECDCDELRKFRIRGEDDGPKMVEGPRKGMDSGRE